MFAKGGERFPHPKDVTPGPGAYDPKLLSSDLGFKEFARQAGDRFAEEAMEEGERPDLSPPRERKPVAPGDSRKFSWATQRIHDLTKELELAQAKIKDQDKALKELTTKLQKASADSLAFRDQKEQLQISYADLEAQQHKTTADVKEALSRLSIADRDIEALKDQLSLLQSSESELRAENQQMTVQVTDLAAWKESASCKLVDASTSKADLESKVEELKVLQRTLEDAQTELTCSRREAEANKVEAQQLHQSLDGLQSVHVQVSSQLSACMAESEECQSSLRAKDEILETLRAQVASQVARAMGASHELESTRVVLQERENQLSDMVASLSEAHNELVASQNMVLARETSLQQSLSENSASLELLAGAREEVQQLHAHVESMNQELQKEKNERGQAESSLLLMQQQYVQLALELEQTKQVLQASVTETRQQLEMQSQHTQQLEASWAESRQQMAEMVSVNARIQAVSKEQQLSIAELQGSLEAKQTSLKALESEKSDLLLNLTLSKEGTEKLHQELEVERAMTSSLQEQLLGKNLELQHVQVLMQQLEVTIEEQAASLEAISLDLISLNTQLEVKDRQVSDQAAALVLNASKLQDATSQCCQQTTALALLEHKIATQEAVITDSEKILSAKSADLVAVKSELASCVNEISQLKVVVHERDVLILSLHAKLKQCQGEVSEAQAAMAAQQQHGAILLEETRQHLNTTLDMRATECKQVQEALLDKTSECKQVQEALDQRTSEYASAQASAKALRAEMSEMQFKIGSLAAALDLKTSSASQQASEAERLKEKVAGMQILILEQISQIQALQTSLDSSEASRCAEHEEASRQLERVSQEAAQSVEQARAQQEALRGEILMLRNEFQAAQQVMEGERSTSASAVAAVVEQKNVVQSELQELKMAAVKECEDLQMNISLLTEQNQDLSSEKDKMMTELTEAQQQVRGLQAVGEELYACQQQLGAVQLERTALETEVQDLRARVASMTPIIANAKLDSQVRALSDELHRASQIAAQASQEAARYSRAAETARLEMQRLSDENACVVACMKKMEININDLLGKSELGHSNQRQKIQYHLRLKQELEEMRHECTVLLREKFHLEQCIRYLSVKAKMPEAPPPPPTYNGNTDRTAAQAIMPSSLIQSVLFSTPIGQKSMRIGARAKGTEEGTVYSTGKESIEAAIESARRRTLDEVGTWLPAPAFTTMPPDYDHETNPGSMDLCTPPRQQQQQHIQHGADASSDFPGFNLAPIASSTEVVLLGVPSRPPALVCSNSSSSDRMHDSASVDYTVGMLSHSQQFTASTASLMMEDDAMMMMTPPPPSSNAAVAAAAHVTLDASLSDSSTAIMEGSDLLETGKTPSTAAINTLSGLEARIMAKIASVCTPNAIRAASKQSISTTAASNMTHSGHPSGGGSAGGGPAGGSGAAYSMRNQDLRGSRDQHSTSLTTLTHHQIKDQGTLLPSSARHSISTGGHKASSLQPTAVPTSHPTLSASNKTTAWGSSLQLGGGSSMVNPMVNPNSNHASAVNTGGGNSSARWGSVFKV
ncbi:hypothetical protein CEUSTIGMA_g7895.t1 [Chlamydomonas eustigma]|uniref:Uncharacterized protein n=1 Tax=Chlamydomonas eustigma TaxID=1157962 RepID=A0A250XBM1_9CHLO|nr:hypothetical protein CEUSTIGMA_g7895.t1 [Chlamydomonas eustigma]|eukprot:GAX80456.1 hypothetical protein CEUSTIGMA_g7895.t1 [Chlamydomonas eustigma]